MQSKRRILISFIFLIFIVRFIATQETNNDPRTLYEEYQNWRISQNPLVAYYLGYDDSQSTHVNDYSFAGLKQRYETAKNFSAQASNLLNDTDTGKEDLRFLKMIQFECGTYIKSYELKGYLLPPVTFKNGIQVTLPAFFNSPKNFKWETNQDFERNLKILDGLPKMIRQIQTLLEEGIKEKMTFAKVSIQGTIEKLQALQKDFSDPPFFSQFARNILYRKMALQIIEKKILPAFNDLEVFLSTTYLDSTRKGNGVSSMGNSNGDDAYYNALLEYSTTLTNVNATEFYEYGYAQLEKSQKRLVELAHQLGFATKNQTVKQAIEAMYKAKSMFFTTPEAILDNFKDELENIKGRLPRVFEPEILTDSVYEVTPHPMGKGRLGIAYFSKASIDGRRKGAFYVNMHNLKSITRNIVATITLHEATPGHHMQDAILSSSQILPRFVTQFVDLPGDLPSSIPSYMYVAYKEGWGLYSEYLGYDLGIYQNEPMKELGYIKGDLLRSARLVVDVGLHKYGWTREKAIEFLIDNTGFSKEVAEAQIDRYISLPGQAVAYKIGEREIQRLRKKYTQEMGLSLQKFHTYVLKCIGPLGDLESCILGFIHHQ